MRTLLVVDDDERLRGLLAEYLGERGFRVETAPDGESGMIALQKGGIDLVILDVMLPGKDGFEVCRAVRATGSAVPIVMLTARGDDTDRIVGLEIGADDYLPKPFNPRELLARVQAVLRRADIPGAKSTIISAGPVDIDTDRRTATLDGALIELTTTEFEILRTLVANAGKVIPREDLMSLARGEEWAAFDRSVDVHISHLRKKLKDDSKTPSLIKTVRGVGYTMPRSR